MGNKSINQLFDRRKFIKLSGLGVGAGVLGLQQTSCAAQRKSAQPLIQGFEETPDNTDASKGWVPVSDRKIRCFYVQVPAAK